MQLCGYGMYIRDLARKPCCLWHGQAPTTETGKKNTPLAAHCLRCKHGTIHWILKNLRSRSRAKKKHTNLIEQGLWWSRLVWKSDQLHATSKVFQHLCFPLLTTKRFIVVNMFRCFSCSIYNPSCQWCHSHQQDRGQMPQQQQDVLISLFWINEAAETVEENIHPVEDSFHVTQRRCETAHHSNIVTLWLWDLQCSALRCLQKIWNICLGTENRRPPSKLPTAARLPAARPKARPRRRRLLGCCTGEKAIPEQDGTSLLLPLMLVWLLFAIWLVSYQPISIHQRTKSQSDFVLGNK